MLYGSLIRHFMLNVYSIEGGFDGREMRALVADDGTTLDYIAQLMFPSGASISRKGRISALDGPNLANREVDLVVAGANRLLTERYTLRGFRIIPKWVQLSLPVVEDPYARLSAFGRPTRSYFNRKIHKIKDAQFECEVVKEKSWFYRFYQEMYKPYVVQRFNDNAVVYEPDTLKKFFDKGFMIIAKKNGEPVAGEIVYREGDTLHTPFMGILNGDLELVKEGAMFALHYYLAEKSHEWGGVYVNFGLSRPFLSDGTLQYKLQWHMDVALFDDVANVFAVATPNSTPQAMRFLEENPHFLLDRQKCVRSDGNA